MSIGRALTLLRGSRQIQLIALVISFGSLGAPLHRSAAEHGGRDLQGRRQDDAIGAFLAQVRFYTSSAAASSSRSGSRRASTSISGIGFALMILPTNLALTAALILLNNVLWAPALARVIDQSFRYTVDKTTREVLFLPLPSELRQEVKPFVDVTVDRLAQGGRARC